MIKSPAEGTNKSQLDFYQILRKIKMAGQKVQSPADSSSHSNSMRSGLTSAFHPKLSPQINNNRLDFSNMNVPSQLTP